MILFTQLDRFAGVSRSFDLLDIAAVGGMAATLLGLLTAVVGSVIWARRASTSQVVTAAVLIFTATVLIVSLVAVNIHGPSAILVFVVPFSVLDAILLLLTLGLRRGGS